jgi:hypothetical protein
MTRLLAVAAIPESDARPLWFAQEKFWKPAPPPDAMLD